MGDRGVGYYGNDNKHIDGNIFRLTPPPPPLFIRCNGVGDNVRIGTEIIIGGEGGVGKLGGKEEPILGTVQGGRGER